MGEMLESSWEASIDAFINTLNTPADLTKAIEKIIQEHKIDIEHPVTPVVVVARDTR